MPIPTPNPKESQGQFVSRCMRFFSDEGSDLEQKQQLAICYDKYRKWQKNRRKRAKAKLAKTKSLLQELNKLKEYYDNTYRMK